MSLITVIGIIAGLCLLLLWFTLFKPNKGG